MICIDCRTKSHEPCVQRNVNKQPADCECQHRVAQKAIVTPVEDKSTGVISIPVIGVS